MKEFGTLAERKVILVVDDEPLVRRLAVRGPGQAAGDRRSARARNWLGTELTLPGGRCQATVMPAAAARPSSAAPAAADEAAKPATGPAGLPRAFDGEGEPSSPAGGGRRCRNRVRSRSTRL